MDSRDRGRKQQGYRKRLVTGISLGRGSKESSPGGIEHQAPPRPSDPGGVSFLLLYSQMQGKTSREGAWGSSSGEKLRLNLRLWRNASRGIRKNSLAQKLRTKESPKPQLDHGIA